jgi:hypothetical protein
MLATEFEAFEYLSLLAMSEMNAWNCVNKELKMITSCKLIGWVLDCIVANFCERLLETIIQPFQNRAKRFPKRECCISNCERRKNRSIGGLGFCEKHEWVAINHETRHDTGSRLFMLLLCYDDTPYRHVKAAKYELFNEFHFAGKCLDFYAQGVSDYKMTLIPESPESSDSSEGYVDDSWISEDWVTEDGQTWV